MSIGRVVVLFTPASIMPSSVPHSEQMTVLSSRREIARPLSSVETGPPHLGHAAGTGFVTPRATSDGGGAEMIVSARSATAVAVPRSSSSVAASSSFGPAEEATFAFGFGRDALTRGAGAFLGLVFFVAAFIGAFLEAFFAGFFLGGIFVLVGVLVMGTGRV